MWGGRVCGLGSDDALPWHAKQLGGGAAGYACRQLLAWRHRRMLHACAHDVHGRMRSAPLAS